MTILLIDNYDSFSFNLVQELRLVSAREVLVHRNDRIELNDVARLKPSGIVLSPGPGHPASRSDFGICAQLIVNQTRLGCPVLGVCLGHQGIVHTLGGIVHRADRIMHGKTSIVRLIGESSLFRKVPEQFVAMRYHSLAADEASLPACLQVTARETETGTIMAIEHKTKPIYGLQFHPESIGTPVGRTILENFVELCA